MREADLSRVKKEIWWAKQNVVMCKTNTPTDISRDQHKIFHILHVIKTNYFTFYTWLTQTISHFKVEQRALSLDIWSIPNRHCYRVFLCEDTDSFPSIVSALDSV